MVSNPMACAHPEDNPNNGKEMFLSLNLHTGKANRYAQAALIHLLAKKIWDNSPLAGMIRSLYAGPSLSEPESIENNGTPGYPISHARRPVTDIDITRIEAVVSFNSFRPYSVLKLPIGFNAQNDRSREDGPSALYFQPSLMNHSCLSNSHTHFFKDVMVIRASQAIAKGEEITIAYFNGTISKERDRSGQWEFKCTCELCLADRIDGESAVTLREQLLQVSLTNANLTVRQAKTNVERIKETYAVSQERDNCMTKPDLASAYRALGKAYSAKAASTYNFELLVQMIEAEWDGLAALGVIIKDRSVRGPFRRRDAMSLPINTDRGPSHYLEFCTLSSVMIVQAFYCMGDIRRAEDWMKVAMWCTYHPRNASSSRIV